MRVLLDTHVLIWASGAPEKISPVGREILEDGGSELVWSAVGTVELAIKAAQGKLRLLAGIEAFLEEQRVLLDLEPLPLNHRHALRLATLPGKHGDPFDRLLVAQAQVERMPLLSADARLREYEVEVLW